MTIFYDVPPIFRKQNIHMYMHPSQPSSIGSTFFLDQKKIVLDNSTSVLRPPLLIWHLQPKKQSERKKKRASSPQRKSGKKTRDASPSEKKTSENIEKKQKKSLLDNFTTVLGSPLLVWDLGGGGGGLGTGLFWTLKYFKLKLILYTLNLI